MIQDSQPAIMRHTPDGRMWRFRYVVGESCGIHTNRAGIDGFTSGSSNPCGGSSRGGFCELLRSVGTIVSTWSRMVGCRTQGVLFMTDDGE